MTARVVIVGGGVLGTMLAYLATARGCDVLQLEREASARGASVRNFGLIWVSGRRPGAELAFALRSRALWEEIAKTSTGVGFRPNRSLTILQHKDEVRVAEEVLERPDAVDRQLSLLDPDEVRAVNPAVRGNLIAGLLCETDAAVEPRRVAEGLRGTLAQTTGYRWLADRHVVDVSDQLVRDHLGTRHSGDVILVCPGAAHRSFSGWDADLAPLRRVRLQMLETDPFRVPVTTSIADGDSLRYYPAFDVPALARLHKPPTIVAEHKIQLLLQQRLDGCLTIGDTHEYDEPFDVAVSEAPYDHLRERAESILGVPLPAVRRRWAGVYSQALDDRLFYCERIAESAWVVSGAGGRGMTLAPAIAERVLDEVGLATSQRSTASRTAL